ncbi:protein DOG1-like 3 [Bidens hawaiensis]|uniref:protein DOG1-like 3 n=1 Tax=Bidens hawaiensis TaxID=980011 RepID=UPI00404AD334
MGMDPPSMLAYWVSPAFMAEAHNNPTTSESFNTFFQNWISEQNTYLQQLVTAANNHKQIHNQTENGKQLVQKVVQHYEQYYQEKSVWETRDAISMLTPAWRSSLEDAFLWIGGWRPTLAIHLLYSKSGLQLKAKLGDLIRGISTGDLGDLAPKQMERIDELHKKTVHEERVLTEKLQESVADRSMVELSNAVSEMMRSGESDCEVESEEKVRRELELKNEDVEELMHMADELRMETLKALIEVLTPIQAVYFLIAAAELHEWGKKR